MKKAMCAIVTYKDNWIYNCKIMNCKGNFITLIVYDKIDVAHPFKDRSKKTMIESILKICENNGYRLHEKPMFGTTFYNIAFIDLNDPTGYIQDTVCK